MTDIRNSTYSNDHRPFFSEIRRCQKCNLFEQCAKPVPGEGSLLSPVVLLGRNPGRNEDLKNRPFIGRGGQRLFQTLANLGYSRNQFYVTNMVKCYTQDDFPPPELSVNACDWWVVELEKVQQSLVIALGNQVYSMLAEREQSTIKHRRIVRNHYLGFQYVGVIHPGAAVRNGRMQTIMEEDLEWALKDVAGLTSLNN